MARFWDILARTRPADGAGTEDHVEAIGEALRELPAAEIAEFKACLVVQKRRLYRWDLWGVAYIARGGCSDDSFDYFRGWLIAQGREYVERAVAEPARAVDALTPGEDADCESLDYVANTAYETRTGDWIPSELLPAHDPPDPVGEPWSEDEVYELFPDVTRRFAPE